MTDVSSPAARSVPRRDPRHDLTAAERPAVPLIPAWFTDWGFLPALGAGLLALAGIASFGYAHGPSYGWTLLVSLVCVIAALWWLDYDRRRESSRRSREQVLYGLLEMGKVDLMTGPQFVAKTACGGSTWTV